MPLSIRVFAWLTFVLFAVMATVPTVYAIVWAFWGTDVVGILSGQPTLKWFSDVFFHAKWRDAIICSALLGIVVSLLGCLAIACHCYAARFRSITRIEERVVGGIILLPLLIPGVIYGLALLLTMGRLHLTSYAFVILAAGHMAVIMPIQYFIFDAQQEGINSSTIFSGVCLGAGHIRNMFVVYLPLAARPMMYAFLAGFFLSFDETVVSLFVLNSSRVTIPRRMWDEIDQITQPIPGVVATLLILVVALSLFCVFVPSMIRFVDREVRKYVQ